MDTMDLSGFDLDKKTVKNLLTNNFTGKNNGPITLDQGFTVSKLMDLYGDDELALQAIDIILIFFNLIIQILNLLVSIFD